MIVRLETMTGESYRHITRAGNATGIRIDENGAQVHVAASKTRAQESAGVSKAEIINIPWHNVRLWVEESS